MRIADVMDDVAARLRSIPNLNVFAWPVATVTPPAAVVSYPEVSFDATYTRGADRFTLPVLVLIGKAWERSARDLLSEYMDGSGSRSIKAVLESGTYTAFDSLRVINAEYDVLKLGQTDFLVALFDCDIIGSGA